MLGSDTCPLYAELVTLAPACAADADADADAADGHAAVTRAASNSVSVATIPSDRDARLGDEEVVVFIVTSLQIPRRTIFPKNHRVPKRTAPCPPVSRPRRCSRWRSRRP